MPGRPRGRAVPPEQGADAYPGYPGYGGHPDDGGYDDHQQGHQHGHQHGHYEGQAPPPARNGRPTRNGSAPPPAARRGPARRDDDHEPLYARDQTPLGYDGGDPDDQPDSPALLTHSGGGGDRGRRGPARGRNGAARNGAARNGFDRNGFDREGFDRDGFDREGFDRDGFDRDGLDVDGYDRDGFDVDGYDRDGYPADDLVEDHDAPGGDHYDGYDDRYDDPEYDEYEEYDDYEDDEDYDDDAYGVGDGPLAVPPPGSNGRPLGPADVEELDPSMTDALARVDLGSVQVPVPYGAELKLEGTEGGRPQAAHLMLPEGRIAVSALAAPRTSGLWADLCDEIEESLRGGGAQVRTAHGDWGRELHARTENAASVFIGADGPRWMVYGVATAAMDTVEALDVELRRVMRGIIVVRGKLPYPPRTVLPLERAEDRAEADGVDDKPRTASITVSVPAARPADGAAVKGSAATTRTPAAADGTTTRTPAAADGTTTRTPAAGAGRNGAAARNGAARDGAAAGGPARNGVAPEGEPPGGAPAPSRNGAARPGPARPGTPPAASAGGAPAGPDRRRPVPPPPSQRPDGPPPAERPAANGSPGPAAGRPAGAVPPPEQARPGRAPDGPRESDGPREPATPEAAGSAPAPLSAEETGVLRPRGAVAPGAPPAAGGAERTGARLPRRGEQTPSAAARTPEDTGRDTAWAGPEAGADRHEDTGAARARPDDGRARAGGRVDDGGARHPRRGTGEPVAPPETGRTPTVRPPSPVDRPAAGYPDETPVSGTAAVRRDDLLWTPRPADEQDDAHPTGLRPGPGGDGPSARRDPAVTSLPSFGPEAGSDRVVPPAEPTPDTAWTPPSGISALGAGNDLDDLRGGYRGDDEPTPRGGSRSAGPDVPDDRDRDQPPSWPSGSDPEPAPTSRMAIEDIPLTDVPLVEATLDSAPVAPSPELPRRRPSGGARRRDASATEGRTRRRAAPEENVLSDWMSAEIAARPSGRHADPGERDRSTGDGTSVRSLSERRGTDRAASGDDLFRTTADGGDEPGGGRRGHRAEDRTGDRTERRRRRSRTGTDGRTAASADDPMSLFRAPDDSGRHRR